MDNIRILSIGSGVGMFNADSEDRNRMIEYSKYVDRFDVLLSCCGNFKKENLSDKCTLNPTNSKYKISRFRDTFLLGKKIIKNNKINVIFSQDPIVNGFTAMILSRIYKTKLVVSLFGTNVFDEYWKKERKINSILKFVGAFVMKRADLIQTDSLGIYNNLKEIYPEKIFYKPIIPSDIKNYFIDKKVFLEDETRILFVGRMVKQKNIKMLSRVIDVISKKKFWCKVKFTIIGDGSEKYLLNNLEKDENIKFINSCNREELKNNYRDNDILILTSYYEGFPRVFMEAAASKLPIVTTNVSGAINIVKDSENGFIVDHDDIENFIFKLEKLINDRKLLMEFSENIIEYFNKNYDYKMTIDRQIAIFKYLENLNEK